MEARGVVWQDRDASKLLDENPLAYKPIEVVMEDAADLVEPVATLRQFINYKGL
jgi:tRNA-splicing ligase RtcB